MIFSSIAVAPLVNLPASSSSPPNWSLTKTDNTFIIVINLFTIIIDYSQGCLAEHLLVQHARLLSFRWLRS